VTNYATQQTVAPTSTSDKTTNAKTQAPGSVAPAENAATAAPKVAADRGVESTDRDPVTGLVYDKEANNKAATTTAKTFVGDDGTVHYAEQNPDGSPKSPAEDKEGFAKLSPEQQKAVMQDFKSKLEAYAGTQNSKNGLNADGSINYLDPKQFSQLDVNGQLAAVNHFLDPSQADPSGAKQDPQAATAVDKSVKQSLTATADGVVHFTPGLDADGNLLPLDPKALAGLSPQQLSAVKSQYATALREQAKTQAAAAGGAPNDFMGTGMSQQDFEALPADQQADALEGIKPPVTNPDGTVTSTGKDGTKTTKDPSTGRVTLQVAADGTQTAFGTDGKTKTVTSADGNTITTTDSQGKTTVTHPPGSPEDVQEKAMNAVAFNKDGTQMSSLDAYAKAAGITDTSKMTPKQQDDYKKALSDASVSQWSQGEAYAKAAVQSGLLTQARYNQMMNADYAHSFGAWGLRNKDIIAAIKNSNLPVTPTAQPSRVQGAPPQGEPDDAFFADMRGGKAYVDPTALQQTDYTNDDGTLKAPNVGALAGAAQSQGLSYDNTGKAYYVNPTTGAKVYVSTGTPVSAGTIDANGWSPTAKSPAPAPVTVPPGYVIGTDGKLYPTGV
jgi:hypothetical protein